ncbi:unnamed protein product [Meganyctiphanes norvegica]|uniref:Uncharacterized protein n=1 Tax=Meganyctiphanes norvegica TaxID=48144 RepID=A0AAV2S478_MEGNR
MQSTAKLLVLLALSATVYGSPIIPIWEMLTHQEKMGRLMYVFTHLVDNYCKGSNIPDCNKVLTLYGMSNLVNEDDSVLNLMDPYQRNSRTIIWEKVMRGDFKFVQGKNLFTNDNTEEVRAEENYAYANEVRDGSSYQVNQKINKLTNDPHPYAVRVSAPSSSKIDASNSARSSLTTVEDYITENSDIVVGSSHPYAVKIRPAAIKPVLVPVGYQASGDYEPMMVESQVPEARVLPRTLTVLTRTRRTVGEEFTEEEMQTLLSQVLHNEDQSLAL